MERAFEQIVYPEPGLETLLQKLSATIDIGYSLTKANNLKQFTIGSTVGYHARNWSTDLLLNSLNSTRRQR